MGEQLPGKLTVWPGVLPELAGDVHTVQAIRMEGSDAYFPGHVHVPRSSDPHDELEVYFLQVGSVLVYIRESEDQPWQEIVMDKDHPFVAILPQWKHAGRLAPGCDRAEFHVYTRVDHLRMPEDQGGNIIVLPRDQQPPQILLLMVSQETRQREASGS